MRTIKFRAWDKIKKRFWTEEEMNEIGGFYYNHGISPDPEEFDLQQFTGLKDKKGVEIYEGDVVMWGVHQGSVEIINGSWMYEDLMGVDHRCEIIGNIYENPELISDKK